MKNTILILLFIAISFASCKTPQSFTTTVTETKYRDTTIYVESPPIYIDKIVEVPVPSDSVRIIDSIRVIDHIHGGTISLSKSQGIISLDAMASYRNNTLKLDANAYLNDSTILYHYKDTLTWADSVTIFNAVKEKTTTTETQVVLPPEKYVPKIYKIAMWIVIIGLIIGAFLIYRSSAKIFDAIKKLLKL